MHLPSLRQDVERGSPRARDPCTNAAVHSDSRALTYGNLNRLVAECRKLLADLTSRKVDGESLVVETVGKRPDAAQKWQFIPA